MLRAPRYGWTPARRDTFTHPSCCEVTPTTYPLALVACSCGAPRRRQDRSSSPPSGRFVLPPAVSAVSSHQTKEQPNKHIPY
jgi:hypothetical protein